MRLISYELDGREYLGAWINNDLNIVDLQRAAQLLCPQHGNHFTGMQQLIEGGDTIWGLARELIATAPQESILNTVDVRILMPLRPAQLRDFICFEEHLLNSFSKAKEVQIAQSDDPEKTRAELDKSGGFDIPKVWYDSPVYYNANRMTSCGTGVDVHWPSYSKMMDYELEWAAVVGKPGKDISRENARDYIFGYTIFNDFSARDEQLRIVDAKLGPGSGKDFENSNVFGPCIVTADELDDPYSLTMTATVNGEEWSRGSTESMYHNFEDIVAYVSRSETIYPGEVFGSGTVGTGCGLEQMRFLKSGDVVELTVEKIGSIRNRVL